jgi:hypothetical protein
MNNRIRLHNTDFGLSLTFDDFGVFLIADYENVTIQFYLENYSSHIFLKYEQWNIL